MPVENAVMNRERAHRDSRAFPSSPPFVAYDLAHGLV